MKIDIYGRIVEVINEKGQWNLYSLGEGTKVKSSHIVIPPHYSPREVLIFLADIYHEAATPESPDVKLIE